LPEPGSVVGHGDGAVHTFQRGVAGGGSGLQRALGRSIQCCFYPLWC